MAFVKATPYARKVARQYHIDLTAVKPTGPGGVVLERDVVAAREGRQKRLEVPVTPLAQRMARSLNIDLHNVRGTGIGGKISKADVLKAAGRGTGEMAPGEHREALTGMRRIIAEKMAASVAIPTVTVTTKVDVTRLSEMRDEHNRTHAHHYSFNDLILAAVAKALAANKRMLCRFDGDGIIYVDDVNIGMAVALDEGLLVPVIRNADRLSLDELSGVARSLARRARERHLSPDECRGAAFSVSNMGVFGVEAFTPILNPPDSAILGVCAVSDAWMIRDGVPLVRKVMRICLTFDHRVMDGAQAAKFNLSVREYLEHPESLFEDE